MHIQVVQPTLLIMHSKDTHRYPTIPRGEYMVPPCLNRQTLIIKVRIHLEEDIPRDNLPVRRSHEDVLINEDTGILSRHLLNLNVINATTLIPSRKYTDGDTPIRNRDNFKLGHISPSPFSLYNRTQLVLVNPLITESPKHMPSLHQRLIQAELVPQLLSPAHAVTINA